MQQGKSWRWNTPHLQGLSKEGSFLRFGPLDAFKTQLHLLPRGCLHVKKQVQQRADQACGLGLADGDQERTHKLQQTPKFCGQQNSNACKLTRILYTWNIMSRYELGFLWNECVWTSNLVTCCLASLGQECPQLQDALFLNSNSFFIIFLHISPHF